MTRNEMRTILARHLQDPNDTIWSEAVKNTYLGLGLQFMQSSIMQFAPEAFQEVSTTNLISTGDWPMLYPKPQGLLKVIKVEVQESGEDDYSQAFKRRNDQIDQFVLGNEATSLKHWAQKGRWVRIYPTPSAASTDGLRLTFVPTLAMGADTYVPDIPLMLHKGIILMARLEALGDTDEDVDQATLDAIGKRLSVVLERIPLYYGQDHGEPEVFEVGIDHLEGW